MAGSDADVARRVEVLEASEHAGLIGDAARPQTHARRGRWIVLGLSSLALAGVALRRAFTSCQVAPTQNILDHALVSLAEAPPEDLTDLIGKDGNHDAPRQWLLQRTQANAGADFASAKDEHQALRKVMSAVTDPAHARTVLRRAQTRSVGKWHLNRKALKQYLSGQSSGISSDSPTQPVRRARTAECVFNVTQAIDQVAALAANMNTAAKQCAEGKALGTANKVCTADVRSILSSVSGIAGALSLATGDCAETMVPSAGALCAGAVSGIVTNVAQLSGSTALVAAACDPQELFEDTVASNLRSLQPLNTQCDISLTSVAWWLARVGLAISAAANPGAQASCDLHAERGLHTTCTVDVAGAVNALGEAVQFLKLAASRCSDEFNVKPMCAAGIETIDYTFTGIRGSAIALPFACRDDHKEETMLSDVVAGKLGQLASVAPADEKLTELQGHFSSPQAVWKSMGYDLDDQNAEFWTVRPHRPVTKDVINLMEEPRPVESAAIAVKSGGLLGSEHVCS